MQVMVTGKVLEYGPTASETIYKARRVVARTDNNLSKKVAAQRKKGQKRRR